MARPKLVDNTGRFLLPVVIDTREQLPWDFAGLTCDQSDGGGPLTIPTVVNTLTSGDYSILGYETRVAIERKSLADLYGTVGQGRDRFERELERLAKYDFAAVVIEATWEELASEPPPHTQLPPKTVFRSILAWSVRYPRVHWLPCGPRRLAEVTTFRLLERFVKEDLANGGNLISPLIDPGEIKTSIGIAADGFYQAYKGARWLQAVGAGNGELVVYCREKPKAGLLEGKWHGFPVKVVVIGQIRPARGTKS